MKGSLPWQSMAVLAFAGGIAATAVSHGATAAPRDDLAVRVQRIEDRAAIERLLLDYGAALDRRDFAGYARLFAADGEWSGTVGGAVQTFRGPAGIQAAMEKVFAGAPAPVSTTPTSFHLLTNTMIDVSGDQATAVSKWTFVRVVDNKPVIANAGHYDDRLVRENGRWRFRSRVAPSVLSPVPG